MLFLVSFVSDRPSIGFLVLTEQPGGFSTYMEAKAEVEKLYKEYSDGVVVAAFIEAHKNDGQRMLVYSSVRKDQPVCPVCGNHAKLLQADGVPRSIFGKWYVFCGECGLRTGFYDKADEALNVWLKLAGGAADESY